MKLPDWLHRLWPGREPQAPPPWPAPTGVAIPDPVDEVEEAARPALPGRLEELARTMLGATQTEEGEAALESLLRRGNAAAWQAAEASAPALAGLSLKMARCGADEEEKSKLARAGLTWLQAQEPGLAPAASLGLQVAGHTDTYEEEWSVLSATLASPQGSLADLGWKLADGLSEAEGQSQALRKVFAALSGEAPETAALGRAAEQATSYEDEAASARAVLKAHREGTDTAEQVRRMLRAIDDDEGASKVGQAAVAELGRRPEFADRAVMAHELIGGSTDYATDRAVLEAFFKAPDALALAVQAVDAGDESEGQAKMAQAALHQLQSRYPVASLGMLAGQAASSYEAEAAVDLHTLKALQLDPAPRPVELARDLLDLLASDHDAEDASRAGQAILPALQESYANPQADALIDQARQAISAASDYDEDVSLLRELFRGLAGLKNVREQVEDLAAAVTGQEPGGAVAETGRHVILGNVALKVRQPRS